MLTCTSCGAQNPGASKFCDECGTALARSRPACGAALGAAQRFGGECGTPQSLSAAAPAAAPPVVPTQAERRVCSVLFVDLVGFTPLSEARDAEDVRELLSQYVERARTVIARYGGVVEKFIGESAGHLAPLLLATRALARAINDRSVRGAHEAIAAFRSVGSPFHLAHALLDLAALDPGVSAAAIEEVAAINAGRRAATLTRRLGLSTVAAG